MLPVLQLGPFAIQTYPLALVLAGWVALAIGARAARAMGVDGDHVYNAGLYGLAGGVLAARLAHVIAFWPAYRSQPLEIVGLNTTAFLVRPGVIAGLAVAGWYLYRRRLPLVILLDAFAPGLLVGLAIANIGALLAGRNPGAPTDLPWAVVLWGVRRHPVQVYEALGLLAVALFVLSVIRAGGRSGFPALIALLGWGLVEWLVEAFRAAEVTSTLPGGLRLGQVLGLAVALVALIGLRHLATRDQDQPPPYSAS
ncbi:MAG: prolipoprotein diacylglyceryl transferase [Nitrososphaerales archaeon]